ncbi:formate dehydrogenase subunit alpha [Thiobacillus denitrificans]|uniref:formate dehydrogenase subunit alpha n=1 Tax=Thiobacillus denitrificans TaxID=36861 RepID=UPI0005703272|nr:formate dehydrogenase subunit alpha [Thiobacillus denitrificans]
MSLHCHHDRGTPARTSTQRVTLSIDGVPVTVPAGTSVMHAAAEAGIDIPKLCATEQLESFGSCRLCVVQVKDRRGYPASCTTLVEEGMEVTTENDALFRLRRGVMELYISDHPLDCLTCSANGNCELQDMAGRVGLREVRYAEGDNHLAETADTSNPYFTYDPAKCIVCSRCVRACSDIQGTFALTTTERGFESRIAAAGGDDFLSSECVSCGACVAACPTASLLEKSVIEQGQPQRSITTTCAYCGVGCSLNAEMQGEKVIRMVPDLNGGANHGHACVKGRFAWGYATHADRITTPMIRSSIRDAWREVSWEEAIAYTASEFRRLQGEYGAESIGSITSSRCSNEETYLVQKLTRAAFGVNNVDTCARVCHSPTGYGLKQTMGESAGTQDFDSVMQADVILVIGANPTDAHPVFGSRMKQRLRQGAKIIIADPRSIDLVETPHVRATHHLPLRPGTNVALVNALAHVVVAEGLVDEAFVAARCEPEAFAKWRTFIADPRHSPEATAEITGVPADEVRAAARLYATGGNASIYYGLGVTEHSQGSTMVMGIANLAMATGNIGRPGVGVNPLRGQNNVQGSCDMGSFPHEFPGYRHVADDATRTLFESIWGVTLSAEPGLRIPNMFDAAIAGSFKGLYVQGEDIVQSDPNTQHVIAAMESLECLVVQDLFLNETAKFAHVFLPGASFLEKDGTFTNSERRISRIRKVMRPLAIYADWEVTQMLSNALGYPMHYTHPSEIMDEIASLTPTFQGVSYAKLDELGSIQWPCDKAHPAGTPTMHVEEFVRGKGRFMLTEYVATDERANRRFPLLLTTGRILTQYNVGAQSRRTANVIWHPEDVLEVHPVDAEDRGIRDGDSVGVQSRAGEIMLRAKISERMQPGVVYTTFHWPGSGANVVTTENSDWATNCPEYKVTAVQVFRVEQPSAWQQQFARFDAEQMALLEEAESKSKRDHAPV